MGGFADGTEDRYEDGASADENGADEGVAGEGFAEDEGCADGVEDEARLDGVNEGSPWIEGVEAYRLKS
jgi:hypothetical protein